MSMQFSQQGNQSQIAPQIAPKNEDPTLENFQGSGYAFSAVNMDELKSDSVCLAVGSIDVSGSMTGEEDALEKCFAAVLDACNKSPNRDSILFRLTQFNDDVTEMRGFVPTTQQSGTLQLRTEGLTGLGKACVDALLSVENYAKTLRKNGDFSSNGIVFILTDGEETVETADQAIARVQAEIQRIRRSEVVDSLICIMIGFKPDADLKLKQEKFAKETGMLYVHLKDATPRRLASLGQFVSQSTSSQSRQIGTGQAASITVPTDLIL